MNELFFGYDPGGNGKHGVASIYIEEGRTKVKSKTLRSVDEVLKWFQQEEKSKMTQPKALGVDTLTIWSTGISGLRAADRALKNSYRECSNRIVTPNSLRGSMSLNGGMVILKLRETYGQNFKVTETHPKLLYYELTKLNCRYVNQSASMIVWLYSMLGVSQEADNISDHEFDAILSAYAARKWWDFDLHDLKPSQEEEIIYPYGKTNFVWPCKIDANLL